MDEPAGRNGHSFSDLMNLIWKARLVVALGCCAGFGVGVLLAFSIQPHYEAHMIVGPASVTETDGAYASFQAGRPVDAGYYGRPQSVPREFVFFEQILRESTISNILARYDGVLENIGQDRLFRFQGRHTVKPGDLAHYLYHHVGIEPVGLTSSRRISYTHTDPDFAVRLLKHLHTIADETIRQKAGAETTERIAWLRKELTQSSNPDHRQALVSLLMTQERQRMLVAMDQPYAAQIIEPPATARERSWPNIPLVIALSTLLGAVAGFFAYQLRRP